MWKWEVKPFKNQNFHSQKRPETEKEKRVGSGFDPGKRKQEGFIKGHVKVRVEGRWRRCETSTCWVEASFNVKRTSSTRWVRQSGHADFDLRFFGDVSPPQKLSSDLHERRQKLTAKIRDARNATHPHYPQLISLFWIALLSSSMQPCDELGWSPASTLSFSVSFSFYTTNFTEAIEYWLHLKTFFPSGEQL